MPQSLARRRPSSLTGIVLYATLVVLFASAVVERAATASDLRRTEIVAAVAAVRDAVVNIHGQKTVSTPDERNNFNDTPHRVNGMGTGVVVDERGYIVTNFHVVDGVRKIEVTLPNNATYVAQLVSSDPDTDLAVIKINAVENLPVIKLGSSSDLMVGEPVFAIGNAFGYQNTVTRGIVSALHRSVQVSEAQSYDDLIQTDASINPGNSGGPLFNIDGEMIGINVAVRAGAQGIGFAIPIDKVLNITTKLLSIDRLENHTHGLLVQETKGTVSGVVVTSVIKDGPAEKLGVKPGDVITAVGKRTVVRPLDLERYLLGKKVGTAVPLTVERDKEPLKLKLALADAGTTSREPASDNTWEVLGLRLEPVPAAQFQQLQSRYRGGLTVTAVRADIADKQGIRRGDVLVGMHIWETITMDNVAYVLARPDRAEFSPIKCYILRGNETRYGYLPVTTSKRR